MPSGWTRRARLVAGCAALLASSLAARAGPSDACLSCHGDRSVAEVMKPAGSGSHAPPLVEASRLARSVHKDIACGDCHAGFDAAALPHAQRLGPVDCAACHGDVSEAHRFHAIRNAAEPGGNQGAPACTDCHGAHDIARPGDAARSNGSHGSGEICRPCHEEVVAEYRDSAHGRAARADLPHAPTCVTCHRIDLTIGRAGGDPLAAKRAQEKTCLSCHRDDPVVRARMAPSAGFVAAYEASVHGRALLAGNARAASCVDCHGAHAMKRGVEAGSRVGRDRIAGTCAACHPAIAADYGASVHAAAVAKGSAEAPVCTTCHGEHEILAHTDPRSPVAAGNVAAKVCTPCHASVRLSEKYGIAADRPATFSDSYHGLAIRGGSVEAANCASCHGAHRILPSSDPTSSISASRLASTCGKCHPGANARFAVGRVHVAVTQAEEPALYWIAFLYIGIIAATIGGMLAHNALDFVKRSRRRFAARAGGAAIAGTERRGLYLRMTVSERLQHGAIALSFVVLVLTGFMLRYPDAAWVGWIRRLGPSVFETRSALHRAGAILMVAAGVVHVGYIVLTQRGRRLVVDLLPARRDLADMVGVLRYNLGRSRVKPRFGRFSYVEKSEYWALVWGTFVMALTGGVMWFENASIGLVTKLGWDIARTIHFYEAWLATLAILVWHLYFVMFNPDVYPMSLAWLTGTLTEAEMEEEHPLELEANRLTAGAASGSPGSRLPVGSSRVDLQACKLEYSIVSPK